MNQSKLEFYSYDGIKLVGDLVVPDRIIAAALLVHGIQSYRDEYGFYSDMAQFFSENSIASFRFDFRCHGESTNNMPMERLTLSGVLNDIYAAFDVLKNNLRECKKYLIVGTSFGGGLSALFANKCRDEISLALLVAPVISYERDYIIDTGLGDQHGLLPRFREVLISQDWITVRERKFGRALINEMPYFNAPLDNKVPIHIFHGDSDTAEPLEYSKEYAERAQEVGITVIKGAEHGFAYPGDEDLTHPVTKQNHFNVYHMMVEKILNISS